MEANPSIDSTTENSRLKLTNLKAKKHGLTFPRSDQIALLSKMQ